MHCTYLGVPGYNFQTNIEFFCLKIFFTFTNRVDPDEISHCAAFIWVYATHKSTYLGVSPYSKGYNYCGHKLTPGNQIVP